MAAPNALNAILKLVQSDEFDDASLVRKSPFLTSISHQKDFHGEKINWSVNHAGYGGRSHTNSVAEAADVNGAYALFSVGSVGDFKDGKLDGPTVRKALEGSVTTQFVNYVKQEMKLGYGSLNAELARGAFASHTGRRAVVGSFTGATITLATIDDSLYINIGDVLKVSATDGAAHRTGSVTVLTVNTATGVITCTGTVTAGIAAIANADSIYLDGDLNKGYFGLGSYCPETAPTGGDSVFGTDRSVNPEMLAGIRFAGTGSNVETVLIKAMAYARKRPSGAFDKSKIFCAEEDFANIQVAKESSRFVDNENSYGIGIESFRVGTATVVPDVYCPAGTYFIVGEGALELHTVKGVGVDTADGNEMRKKSGDVYAFQTLVDGNFTSPVPYGILRGTWPAG